MFNIILIKRIDTQLYKILSYVKVHNYFFQILILISHKILFCSTYYGNIISS